MFFYFSPYTSDDGILSERVPFKDTTHPRFKKGYDMA
jgi:hypothetical protein